MHLINVWHLMSYRYTKGLKDHIWTYTVVYYEETDDYATNAMLFDQTNTFNTP